MNDRDQLVAYLATLLALVLVFCVALFAASHGVNVTEAFGLGTITGGLIGLLRIPTKQAGNTQADANLGTALDKLPPTTTGTGPAVPAESPLPASDAGAAT